MYYCLSICLSVHCFVAKSSHKSNSRIFWKKGSKWPKTRFWCSFFEKYFITFCLDILYTQVIAETSLIQLNSRILWSAESPQLIDRSLRFLHEDKFQRKRRNGHSYFKWLWLNLPRHAPGRAKSLGVLKLSNGFTDWNGIEWNYKSLERRFGIFTPSCVSVLFPVIHIWDTQDSFVSSISRSSIFRSEQCVLQVFTSR